MEEKDGVEEENGKEGGSVMDGNEEKDGVVEEENDGNESGSVMDGNEETDIVEDGAGILEYVPVRC